MFRCIGKGLTVLGMLVLLSSPASATVMEEVSLEDMVRDADAIVRGRVIASDVRMTLEGQSMRPDTLTTVAVDEWIAGEGTETVQLRELGGVWQQGGVRYDGTPRYNVGDEVILFLERRPEAPHDYRTYAMVQGKFMIRYGAPGVPAMVHRDLSAVAFYRWSSRSVQDVQGEPRMALDTFLNFVRRIRAEFGGVR